jgi:hypothetical protein
MDEFDLPEELFWAGTPEATAENHLKHQEMALLGELVRAFQSYSTPACQQHLQGCSRRLLMMQHARIEILATSHEETKPLASDRLNLLNICLNSFYLNLLGALDNLAWASTWELGLLDSIDESVDEVRKFCSMGGKRFLQALSARDVAFGKWLSEQKPWIIEVKKFRDPAAHRLPLAIVRGLMTEEEGERYQELSQQSFDATLAGRWQESEALQAEADALGKFVPYLDGPRAANNGIYIVPNQMAADQRRFLSFTSDFLRHLARAAA